jgi:hypothetical protein
VTSGPSLEGVDQIRQAAAYLKPYQPPVRKRRWPRWLTAKRLALIVVADLVLANVAWHYLTTSNPGAEAAAVQTVASAAAHNDWSSVYDHLCSSDRSQIAESALSGAGRGALVAIGELDHVTVTSVKSVTLPVGFVHWPAAQVAGLIVPVVGQPSSYSVTVVREVGGGRMCLSAGGFSSTAMGVDVPLRSGSLGLS